MYSVLCMREGFLNALLKFKGVFVWATDNIWNLIVYVITFTVSMLAGYKDMITIICLLSFVDWFLAVINAVRRQNLQSSKMLSLVGKLIMYMIGFLLAASCKKFLDFAAFEYLITASIFLGELISLVSNMILVWPNAPMLKIVDKLLKSELAAKTGLTKEDVETAIKESTTKRKKK